MTPEEARSWLIENGELSADDAADAVEVTRRQREAVDRLAQRDDWVGELYRSRRGD